MSISIVIPLFNKALHIERALRSVFEQTYQDFEIIIVNDGSTDNGREIVENIHDERLRLINQTNQGVSVARNNGYKAAKNKFVAFLDADDEWLPGYLENIQTLITNFPGCGAYATASRTVRPSGQIHYPSLKKLPPEPWIGLLPNFFELLQEGLIFNSSSSVFPKQILQDVGGFPPGLKLSEDMICWIKIAIRYPIAFNPKRLVIYHQDASNRSNVNKNLGEEPYIKIIREAIKNGTLLGNLRVEALEFIAQRQITQAIANIMAGNPRDGKTLLSTCSSTKKYKKKWLWWWFLASFPPGWPEKLLSIKQKYFQTN